jgi:hypothetical protein
LLTFVSPAAFIPVAANVSNLSTISTQCYNQTQWAGGEGRGEEEEETVSYEEFISLRPQTEY